MTSRFRRASLEVLRHLADGSALTRAELIEQLGLNRKSVEWALKRLQQERLVDVVGFRRRPGRCGATPLVWQLNAKTFRRHDERGTVSEG